MKTCLRNGNKALGLVLPLCVALLAAGQALAQTGACCLGNSSCVNTDQAGCTTLAGEFLGEGTSCAAAVCAGACCLSDGTCTEGSRDACTSGTYQGAGSACTTHCGGPLGAAFTYQGQLNKSGAPLTGPIDVQGSLWSAAIGGDPVGSAVMLSEVAVAGGLFTAELDFGLAAFDGQTRWLEIAVRSPHDPTDTAPFTTLSPRQQISAVPYALFAARAGGAWSLAGNAGTSPGTHFLGTTDNQPLEIKVNAARALRIEPHEVSPNIVAGYRENEIATAVEGATIAGGGGKDMYDNLVPNVVTGSYGTIAGGLRNNAYYCATVSGGYYNAASAALSTVGGGYVNTASGTYASVGGGYVNTARGGYAIVAGGSYNTASEDYATVGGGYSNTAAALYAPTIGGGWSNTATGGYSTIPGGAFNTAGGAYSLAAGRRAKIRTAAQVGGGDTDGDEGTFVWADSTDVDFVSTGPNQFNVRANGGVYFDTGAAGTGIRLNAVNQPLITRLHDPFTSGSHDGAGRWGLFMEPHILALGMPDIAGKSICVVKYNADSTYTTLATFDQNGNVGIGVGPGYKLHVNGSVAGVGNYVNLSDGRYKKDIQPISGALQTLSKLEGVKFSWRQGVDPELNLDADRHLGLIAQDVQKVLPEAVSQDGRGRYAVAYGAVVPVLVEAVKEQQNQIQTLSNENQMLKQRNEQLEARLVALETVVSKLAADSKGGRP